jgi:hypothetical protein
MENPTLQQKKSHEVIDSPTRFKQAVLKQSFEKKVQ